MEKILIFLFIMVATSSYCQIHQIPKEVRNHTTRDTIISLEFIKNFDREKFEDWCDKNGYVILALEIDEIAQFGAVKEAVREARIIDVDINEYLVNKEIFRKGKEINCLNYANKIPIMKPDEGFCYICYDGIIRQTLIDDFEVNNYWANGDGAASFNYKSVDIRIGANFRNGVPLGDITIIREYQNGSTELHLFNDSGQGKNGRYILLGSGSLFFVSMNYSRDILSPQFYLYSSDSRLMGGEPVYKKFGDFGIYVSSEGRWSNLFNSASSFLKCMIIDHVSSYGQSSTTKAFLEQAMTEILNVGVFTYKSYGLSLLKHQVVGTIDESQQGSEAKKLIETIDFINCVISQY